MHANRQSCLLFQYEHTLLHSAPGKRKHFLTLLIVHCLETVCVFLYTRSHTHRDSLASSDTRLRCASVFCVLFGLYSSDWSVFLIQ